MKHYINKTIIGFENLNIFLDKLTEINIKDSDLTYDCEERHNDQSKNVYFVQYFL